MDNEPLLKKCTGTCGRLLPATDEYFYKSKVNRDGLYSWCKECKNAYERERARITDDSSMTVLQLSKRAGVTRDVIQGIIRHGSLPAFKVPSKYRPKEGEWRIKLEDAEAYISVITAKVPDTLYEPGEIVEDDGNSEIITENDEPPLSVIKRTDQCDSCGTARGNILGDIDDVTHIRYGYLCTQCRRLVLDAHGDITKIRNVLNYLEQTRPGQV